MKLQKVDGLVNEYTVTRESEAWDAIKWAIEHLGGCDIKEKYEKDEDGDMAQDGYSFISRAEITQASLERAVACDYKIKQIAERVERLEKEVQPKHNLIGWADIFWGASKHQKDKRPLHERVEALEQKRRWWRFGK